MSYFGIDIGGTAVKYGVVEANGEVVASAEYPVCFDGYETPILETVLRTSEEFLDHIGYDRTKLEGIGVSATGQIDSMHGIVAGVGGNIKNWEGAKLQECLTKQFELPVQVVNDANCVALGEKWLGNAKGCHHAIVITIGTGVGGGIIVNDQILLGSLGFAGELGHFSIHQDGVPCTCGNQGCYEQYASMTALVKKVKAKLPLAPQPALSAEEVNGKVIFDLCAKGEPVILKVVDEWIDSIVDGLVSLVHVFNPERILIGGGVSVQEELFIEPIRQKMKGRVMPNFMRSLTIERAALGNQAGLVGAVYYLQQQLQQ